MNCIKPNKLMVGDTVAVVSLSWGGPSIFPWIYEMGVKNLEKLGLKVKEYPTARKDANYLHDNPKFRAEDLNNAFTDKEVKAIIASIGGDDSVRILPFLNKKVALANPKILMGYSDTTILTTFYNHLGLVTFNGPAVMAGIAQIEDLPPAFSEHIKKILFNPTSNLVYEPYDTYSDGYSDWKDEDNTVRVKEPKQTDGWHWLQGKDMYEGELFGGCIEALEFIKGTEFWFEPEFWKGKILFLETSEEKPTPNQIKYMLRNYGTQGVFEGISALLFGRARDYSDEEKKYLDKTIINVVKGEFGKNNLGIVTNMDFGHTDPQIILPLGVRARLDFRKREFGLIEAPLI